MAAGKYFVKFFLAIFTTIIFVSILIVLIVHNNRNTRRNVLGQY